MVNYLLLFGFVNLATAANLLYKSYPLLSFITQLLLQCIKNHVLLILQLSVTLLQNSCFISIIQYYEIEWLNFRNSSTPSQNKQAI